MALETRKVSGLVGLLQATLEITSKNRLDSSFWFRGCPSSFYKLLPSLLRDGRGDAEVFEREQRLLARFRQRSIAYWPEGYPQNDWEHLFAMQHFGFPTRLLDWSENLFVAAHFALLPRHASVFDESDLPTIWCVDPVEWNRSTPFLRDFGQDIHVLATTDEWADSYRPVTPRKRNKSPVAIFGSSNSQRIVAQRGTFFVWGNEIKSLEECAVDSSCQLWKLEVQGDRVELSHELTSLGFGETMIFPELSALATELTRSIGWRS